MKLQRQLLIAISFAASLLAAKSLAAVDTTGVNVFSYAGTNVTTGAYVTLAASTPHNVSRIQVCDTSTKMLKIATGGAGSEKDLFIIQLSGCVVLPVTIPSATRLSIKAIDATASAGYNVISFLP